MDAKIKKLWVDALRSGEFQQAQGALHDKGGYCCLGVLCELHRREEGGEWEGGEKMLYLEADETLPHQVVRWAGLPDDNPVVEFDPDEDGNGNDELATLNDGGWTFDRIAERIEASL